MVDLQKYKFFVTGSGGYIGSFLCNSVSKINRDSYFLTQRNFNNSEYLKGQISEIYRYEKYLKESDVIYHLAFNNNIKDIENNFKKCLDEQIYFFDFLKSLTRNKEKVTRLIFTSSVTIYGNHNDQISEASDDKLFTKYDQLKLDCENYIKENLQSDKFQCINLRLSNIYGKADSREKSRNLIYKIIKNAFLEKKITIFGTGDFYRNYLYIDDLIHALILSVKYSSNLSVYNKINLCSDTTIKFVDLINLIKIDLKKNHGLNIEINLIPNNDELNNRNFICKPELFKKITNWEEKFNLQSGLYNLINKVKYDIENN